MILAAALTVDGKLAEAAGTATAREADPAVRVWQDDGGELAADPVGKLRTLPGGVRRVVCTGPAETFRALLDAGVVDELELLVLPQVDGRRDAATLGGPPGAGFFPASVACRLVKMEPRADGCWLRYRVRRAS